MDQSTNGNIQLKKSPSTEQILRETVKKKYSSLCELSTKYVKMQEEYLQVQEECVRDYKLLEKDIDRLSNNLKEKKNKGKMLEKCKKDDDFRKDTDESKLENCEKLVTDANALLGRLDSLLPKPSGTYLHIILGNIDVSIMNKSDKFRYKESYEKFKVTLTLITIAISVICLIFGMRFVDALFHFLLVWYYCTLTIRESILAVNGSNIHFWWRLHHFIATVCSGILLIWPDGESYRQFRTPFLIFSFYVSFVQVLQYYYQKGTLYRLRALGEAETMDITVEGVQIWMRRGLSFLFPFLFLGYILQFYLSYVLFKISLNNECYEWHVPVLSIIFLVLCIGNIITSIWTFYDKIKIDLKRVRDMSLKYQPLSGIKEFLVNREKSIPSNLFNYFSHFDLRETNEDEETDENEGHFQ
ncbi:hypothetical protein SNEBB_007255 [Seison nebaliae]|nr:hypothetical protein SNEBB_007255 [Seison nebaliae]